MKKNDLVSILSLQTGDRYYSATDKSKKAYCIIRDNNKIFKIESHVADRLRTVEKCLVQAVEVKRNIMAVFLRRTELIVQQYSMFEKN